MALLVRNVALRWGEPEEGLLGRIARTLGVGQRQIRGYAIVRRAIDAREHDNILRVYHVQVSVDGDEEKLVRRGRAGQVTRLVPEAAPARRQGNEVLKERPVVVGTGPAGLFAGLVLAEQGYRPLVLERGQDVPQRHKALHLYYTTGAFDPENNLLFGIGGAGTYSDGKLYSRTHDPRNGWILEQLVRFGADPDILINAKPHVGSDKLPGICRRMIERIREAGGEVRYNARVVDIEVGEGSVGEGPGELRSAPGDQSSGRRIRGVVLSSGERITTGVCVLAIGHSARDTYRMLAERGVELRAKPFQMGVRIEHPQALISRNQYGAASDDLPPADYSLVAKNAAGKSAACGTDVFSFCMCPGGTILPSNESANEICTNGASTSRRNTPFANSGLVVTVLPGEFNNDPLVGLEYQRRWERLAFELSGSYAVPGQRATDFLMDRKSDGELLTSFPLGSRSVELARMLPDFLVAALKRGLPMMERMIPGYGGREAILTAPETRASSPVRIVRSEPSRESVSVAGIYPVGEGAGYAGGIVSSAADGLKSAEVILARYGPLR